MLRFLLLAMLFSGCECRCTIDNRHPDDDLAYHPGPAYYLRFYLDPNLQERGLIIDGARTCVLFPWRIYIDGATIYGPPLPCHPGQQIIEGTWDTQTVACHVPPSQLDDPPQCFGAPLPELLDARYLVPADAG